MLSALSWSEGWSAGGAEASACAAAARAQFTPEGRSAALRRALQESNAKNSENRARWFEKVLKMARSSVLGHSSGSGGSEHSIYSAMPAPTAAADAVVAAPCRAVAMSLERYWHLLPPGIDPAAPEAFLPAARVVRKRQQVANMVRLAALLLRGDGAGQVVVEFCAGSGSLSLPLAACFPAARFILIDAKARSLGVARRRLRASGLTNVELRECYVESFAGKPFDVGLALHACGEASDVSLQLCLAAGAAYVMAPCCVGKVGSGGVRGAAEAAAEVRAAATLRPQAAVPAAVGASCADDILAVASASVSRTATVTSSSSPPAAPLVYPRSAALRHVLGLDEYVALAKAADFGHGTDSGRGGRTDERGDGGTTVSVRGRGTQRARHSTSRMANKRRLCKSLVEHDRNLHAAEQGYEVRLLVMQPRSATPKNDILVGWKPGPEHGGDGTRRAIEGTLDCWISEEEATGCAWDEDKADEAIKAPAEA